MKPRLSLLPLPLVGVLLSCLSGCGTVAKQAFQEWRGARSKIFLVHPITDDTLAAYRTVRFERVTCTVGDELCPPALRRDYDRFASETALELRQEYPGGEPTLRVAPEILYFQKKGLLSGAECLARVRMFNDGGDEPVVDAIVRTESKAFRAGGEEALAESNVETIGDFLKRRGIEAAEEDREQENEEHQGRHHGDHQRASDDAAPPGNDAGRAEGD